MQHQFVGEVGEFYKLSGDNFNLQDIEYQKLLKSVDFLTQLYKAAFWDTPCVCFNFFP